MLCRTGILGRIYGVEWFDFLKWTRVSQDRCTQDIYATSLFRAWVIVMGKRTYTEDLPMKFWRTWLAADELKRLKMLRKTMIVKELSAHMMSKFSGAKLQKGFAEEFAARLVNDYFQDLECALMTKYQKK
jgi:hypothetical protein